MSAAKKSRWSEATRLTDDVSADWETGQDPEAVAVEVLFLAHDGAGYVVFAVGPSPSAAVAAAEEEALERLGSGTASDWRAA